MPEQVALAVSLTLLGLSVVVVVQLRDPNSWLSRRIDRAVELPAAVTA